MNKYFYYKQEVDATYEAYTLYHKVKKEHNELFLYKCMQDHKDVELVDLADVNTDDAELYKPPAIEQRLTISPLDIIDSLKNNYKEYESAWKRSGQDPALWGASVSLGMHDDENIIVSVSEKDYIDKKFDGTLSRRLTHNQENDKLENLYKQYNIEWIDYI